MFAFQLKFVNLLSNVHNLMCIIYACIDIKENLLIIHIHILLQLHLGFFFVKKCTRNLKQIFEKKKYVLVVDLQWKILNINAQLFNSIKT